MNKEGKIIIGPIEPSKSIDTIWIDTNDSPNGGSVKSIKNGEFSPISSGGTTPTASSQIIDMLPGEYLSDVLARITDASEIKPYTINFYNHSKTINWDKWTELIQWPMWVYLNFVNVVWWPNGYYLGMTFDDELVYISSTDRLMIGFKFDRTSTDENKQASGLPDNLNTVYFGGLDADCSESDDYDTLINNITDYGNGALGLVYCKGSKEDDINNSELYKKINGTVHKVTGNFSFCNLLAMKLIGAYLYGCILYRANLQYANLQWANLQYANLDNASLYNANLQNASLQYANLDNASLYNANLQNASLQWANLQNASLYNANLQNANLENIQVNMSSNFINANLMGATNLPENLNTKAKFIAAVGAGHVNAETIWIDGTLILS